MGYTPHILVIGGGVVGTGIARDLAIRGLDVTLVEKGTLAAGATGRMQGVLYSGARYSNSPSLATQLLQENRTLREIASHCIDPTGGLLVVCDDGDEQFETRLDACQSVGIPAEVLDEDEIRGREPELSEDIARAIQVPDAVVDPFRLTVANAKSAKQYGAEIRTHTTVTAIAVDDGTIDRVMLVHDPSPEDNSDILAELGTGKDTNDDEKTTDGGKTGVDIDTSGRGPAHEPGGMDTDKTIPGEIAKRFESSPEATVDEIEPDYVVNAGGAWTEQIAELADLDAPVQYSKGAMAVVGSRPVDSVVTRCREADEANTVVPYGTHAVIGTTNRAVAGPGDVTENREEVDTLFDGLKTIVPVVDDYRALRSYWGVRSWPRSAETEHAYALVDHGDRDGVWGMTTVVGGSFTTHRKVAEAVADDVCARFGITRPCRTDELPLPGSEDPEALEEAMETFGVESPWTRRGLERLGSRGRDVLGTDGPNPVVCECQSVTRAEVRDAIDDETGEEIDLDEVRIRTSATMGECQGGRCAHRLAAELYPEYDIEVCEEALDGLLEERWRGGRHTLWGEQLAQVMGNYEFHAGAMNRKYGTDWDTISFDEFDDGPEQAERERPAWGERPLPTTYRTIDEQPDWEGKGR